MCLPVLLVPLLSTLSSAAFGVGATGVGASLATGAATVASGGTLAAVGGIGNVLTAASAVGTVASGFQQAQQADFASEVAENNAILAGQAADQAGLAGEEQASRLRERIRRTVGSARTGLAAGNVVLGAGSARDIEEGIETAGALDLFQLEQNVALQQRGLQFQATSDRAQASQLRRTARNTRRASFLAGAGTLVRD